jgi:hypothetical protein
MALSREKAKQPARSTGAKAPKLPSKVVKTEKKPAVKLSPAAKPTMGGFKMKGQKTPPIKPGPAKAKPVAEALPPQAQQIEKAKAALKRENATVDVAAVKPISKAKARRISIEASANEAASALAAKWVALNKKAEQIETKTYNMKAVFEEKTAIVHKILGWGYILANRNDRLEVLFKDGIKHLISNYKP